MINGHPSVFFLVRQGFVRMQGYIQVISLILAFSVELMASNPKKSLFQFAAVAPLGFGLFVVE